jgi:hypothetical protein
MKKLFLLIGLTASFFFFELQLANAQACNIQGFKVPSCQKYFVFNQRVRKSRIIHITKDTRLWRDTERQVVNCCMPAGTRLRCQRKETETAAWCVTRATGADGRIYAVGIPQGVDNFVTNLGKTLVTDPCHMGTTSCEQIFIEPRQQIGSQ